jgi:hypothetical protein
MISSAEPASTTNLTLSQSAKKIIRIIMSEMLNNTQLIDFANSTNKITSIFTFSHRKHPNNKAVKRVLVEIVVGDDSNQSNILNAIDETSLSCILVTLFLAIALIMAISCLIDLKTNDKFARNNLHVGKES